MLKVYIADDQISYRSQIEIRLNTSTRMEVVGSSRINPGTFSIIESSKASAFIVELHPDSQTGLKLLEEIKAKNLALGTIIALAHDLSQKVIAQSLGVQHLLLKEAGTAGDEARIAGLIHDILMSIKVRANSLPSTPRRTRPHFLDQWNPRAIVLASSTGGPPVLEKIFSQLSPPLQVPMFIVQHMPEFFTKDLGDRLSSVSGLTVREAIDEEEVVPGICYIAPGNYHMRLVNNGRKVTIKLDQQEKLHSVRPAADYLFQTAATIYSKDCLGIVLTGMGVDGANGALSIRNLGGRIVIQDKESSAVWGMPGATHALGAFDSVESIDSIASILKLSMVRNAS